MGIMLLTTRFNWEEGCSQGTAWCPLPGRRFVTGNGKYLAVVGEDLLGLEIEGLLGGVYEKVEPARSNEKTQLCGLLATWIFCS